MAGMEAQWAMDMYLKTMDQTSHLTESISKAITEFLNYHDRDKNAKILSDHLKANGELSCFFCKKENMKALSQRLTQEGITNVESNYSLDSDTGIIIFAKEQAPEVQNLINEYRDAKNLNGIVPLEHMQEESDEHLRRVDHLNYAEAQLITKHATDLGIDIALSERSPKDYSIYYHEKNDGLMESVRAAAAIEITGEAGSAITDQYNYDNSNFNRIHDRIMHEKEPFSITDYDGNVIRVSKFGVEYKGEMGEMAIKRNSLDFERGISMLCASMNHPIDITKEEYERANAMSKEDRDQFLIQKDKEHGRPDLTPAAYAEMKLMQEKISLYEKKLALDNPEHVAISYAFENFDIKMATFEGFEKENKDAIEEHMEQFDEEIMLSKAEDKLIEFDDVADDLTIQDIQYMQSLELGYETNLDMDDIEREESVLGSVIDDNSVLFDENNNYQLDEYETDLE